MNRPLTEELQSVLRARSLDAPAPEDTIDATLSRTLDRVADGKVVEAPDTGSAAAPVTPVSRRRLVPSAGAVGWIAAAVLVAAGAAGIVHAAQQGQKSTASSASAGQAGPGGDARAAASGAAKAPFGASNGAEGSVSAPSAPRAAPGSVLDCPTGTTPETGVAGSSAGSLSVEFGSCVDRTGVPGAGQVLLLGAGAAPRPLIRPDQGLHLISTSFDDGTVIVRAADWSAGAGPSRGAVSDHRFVLGPAGAVTAQSVTPVAGVCTAADLSLSAADGSRGALIRLLNTGTRSCAVEGLLTVTRELAGTTSRPLGSAIVPAGSSRWGQVGPVLLAPGTSASAVLDAAAGGQAQGCPATAYVWRIGLPATGASLGTVRYTGPGCLSVVGPLVSGPDG